MLVDLGLLRKAVILQFEIKILHPECLLEPVHCFARLVQLVFEDPSGISLARQPDIAISPSLCAASSSLSMRGL